MNNIGTTILSLISGLTGFTAYATIIGVLLLCGLGLPIPEDITLLAAGLLASADHISLTGALIAGFTGVLAGDTFLFFMGRYYGRRVFAFPGLRVIFTEERLLAAEERIRRNAHFICFIARFLPGLRSPIFATVGMMGVKPRVFFLQDGVAALISVPVWVYLGYWFGENLDEALTKMKQVQIYLIVGVLALILAYVGYRLWKKKRRPQLAESVQTAAVTQPVAESLEELRPPASKS